MYEIYAKSNRALMCDKGMYCLVGSVTHVVFMNLHRFCNAHTIYIARLFSIACKIQHCNKEQCTVFR